MRGSDLNQSAMYSYLSPEERIPLDHPLRPILAMSDRAWRELSGALPRCIRVWAVARCPPEKLLRALLLQVLYSIRSERMLMEQLEYNLLFHYGSRVGCSADHAVGNHQRHRCHGGCGYRLRL